MLTIVRPGPLTTVQDLGRPGLGAFGIPSCGMMDGTSLRIANQLVGNAEALAGLEFTLAGPEIRFDDDSWVALAGSRFECRRDDEAAPHGESFLVRRGSLLRIGRTLEGARGCLAVAGGIDVSAVLGSRSTFLAGGFGGLEGRALRAGDQVAVGAPDAPPRRRKARSDLVSPWRAEMEWRVIPGPQEDAFTAAGRRTFFSATYRVSPRSNRVGVRLEGPSIERCRAADLPPEGLAPGAVQIPADGLPIVLGADRPTTGGYTKIATVVTADLRRVAHAKPGDRLRFVEIDAAAARELYLRHEGLLRSAIEESS